MNETYFNENDPFAIAWIKELYPDAKFDGRSIVDVRPEDLMGCRRVHLFAGIGGWEYALYLAGWPSDWEVWTGSAPCQPFSQAGRQEGFEDERDLWPEMFRLIRECRPASVMGEQVASAIGFGWLDRLFADLERESYACGAIVLGAHSVGAPHRRQRLYWVADSGIAELGRGAESAREHGRALHAANGGATSGMADAGCKRDELGRRIGDVSGTPEGIESKAWERQRSGDAIADCGAIGGLAVPENGRFGEGSGNSRNSTGTGSGRSDSGGCSGIDGLGDTIGEGLAQRERVGRVQPGATSAHAGQGPERRGAIGFWDNAQFIQCSDGKTRRVEPSIQPLADGVSNRVGKLRGFGNAIVPQLAAEVIRAFMAVKLEQADKNRREDIRIENEVLAIIDESIIKPGM